MLGGMSSDQLTEAEVERAKALRAFEQEWCRIETLLKGGFGDMRVLLNRFSKSSEPDAMDAHRKIGAAEQAAMSAGQWMKLVVF